MMRDTSLAYLETKRPPKTDSALASTIIQHWQARHMYGKAICLNDSPGQFIRLARRRWISAMQGLQDERAKTIDADKLLSLTHAITRMQQMAMTTNAPHEYPAAHFWFIQTQQLAHTELPRTCKTIYVTSRVSAAIQQTLYELIPAHSLVIDYTDNKNWQLTPKSHLEDKVHNAWEELNTFLKQHNIRVTQLQDGQYDIDQIDDALDTLLDNSSAFLRHARHFQEILHLAQPLPLSFTQKQQYELARMLARRVALLTPGILHHSFIQAENDTFSLYDITSPQRHNRESLTTTIARHLAAGRKNLARALETAFVNNSLTL